MISIKYFDTFSVKNKYIVIFITKLSELSTISLPFSISIDLKDNTLNTILNSKNYLNLIEYDQKSKTNYNIQISLVKIQNSELLSIGSSVFDNFDSSIAKNVTFLFSRLIEKKNIIPELILGFQLKSYHFDKYLSKTIKLPENIYIRKVNRKTTNQIDYNSNLLKSVNYTKNLVSEPSNELTPIIYAKKCLNIKIKGLKIKVLDLNQLNKIGMHSLTGVARGSVNEPRVVIFEWNLNKRSKPTVLVGKGVTFDSGGISLKPSNGMEEMIMDMGGSAVVVGSMMNAALNQSKKSLIGIIGLVENMPDGNSQKPGDIVKSLSGQTIEILNTDAEGRLVLGDLITYVYKKYKPLEIIDFATLTGAILVALGTHKAGLFANNDKLANKLISAGIETGENVWRLPLGPEYDSEINSLRADMKNIGSTRYGGSIQAAHFIKRFVQNDTPWAHIDIAGVTWTQKKLNLHQPGATGFGIRLIDKFLKGK